MRRITLAFTVVLSTGGCAWLTEPASLASPVDVTLKIGQTVQVDGRLRTTFVGVPADSRCPANADCFWAGDALVAIVTSAGPGTTCPDTLHTNGAAVAACAGYLISLLQLSPYPWSPGPILPGDYEERLRFRTGL